ncbi:hypothetical protein R6Q59_023273 [Mikania micrantha]
MVRYLKLVQIAAANLRFFGRRSIRYAPNGRVTGMFGKKKLLTLSFLHPFGAFGRKEMRQFSWGGDAHIVV